MMNVRFSVSVLGAILGIGSPAARAQAQSLSDALDTPSRIWESQGSGVITAVNDAALTHDGVDAVWLRVTDTSSPLNFRPSVSTQLEVPSVVEFWHQSRGFDGKVILGINQVESGKSSVWRRHRMVAPAGKLEISNFGQVDGDLYLDRMDIRPAAVVSLAEALDWSFPVTAPSDSNSVPPRNPGTVVGVAESWLALDGVDSILLSQRGASVRTTVPGPALVSYRSRDALENTALSALNSSGNGWLPQFTAGDRTWFWMAGSGEVEFLMGSGPVPVVMDGLEVPPTVPAREALDAPGLDLTLSGAAAGTSLVPPGTSDGDAVLCLNDWPSNNANGGRISLKVDSPAVIRFEYLGTGELKSGGHPIASLYAANAWTTREVMVLGGPQALTWEGNLWVNAVSVQPPPPGRTAGDLLNAPGLAPEFPVPVYAAAVSGAAAGDGALAVTAVAPDNEMGPPVPVIRLPFQGPSVISVWLPGGVFSTRLRIDGGPWQSAPAPRPAAARTFTQVVPGEGPHFLEAAGPVTLDRFQVVPLEEVPLAEALDAPDLVFTTSPGTPWKGYKAPESMGLLGGHGATGGQHAEAGDPWIETRVEGPGVLDCRMRAHASGDGYSPYTDLRSQYVVSIDGGSPQPVVSGPTGTPTGILLGPGPHTARWTQRGSQARDPLATSLWLDRVSFTAGTIPLSEALDTPGRGWTAAGDVLPVAWAGGSPDGVDSVHLRSAGAWVETVVNLPAWISFAGKNLRVTDGAGKVILSQSANSFPDFQTMLGGTGPAALRFSLSENGPAVLDQVVVFEATDRIAPAAVAPPSGIAWRRVDGKPWSVLSNPVTGETRGGDVDPVWMEAVVPGPCVVTASWQMTLPDHGNRCVFDGNIHYAGPQRVLMVLGSETGRSSVNLFTTNHHRPALSLAEALKVPGLTWTSGGEAPWIGVYEGEAVSAPVRSGEVSWIEAEVTGPGVLRWHLDPVLSHPYHDSMRVEVTCDGVAVPSYATRSWLHLTAGPHRVRWQASGALTDFRDDGYYLRLREVGFQPQPTGSVTGILGSPVNLHEGLPTALADSGAPMAPWPLELSWRLGTDPDSGAPLLEADSGAGALTALLPGPGTVTSRLKMERIGPPRIDGSDTLPAAAAPFPWTDWTTRTPVWVAAVGYRTSVDGVRFAPYAPVSVGEALDQPGLEWTADSNPPGLWKALTGIPASESSDPDALYLDGMARGDTAWLETTVEGPLSVSLAFETPASPLPLTFRALLDGRQVTGEMEAATPVRVPPGSHRLRWEVTARAPVPAGQGRAGVIRGAAIESGATLPDVNALIEAPGLDWSLAAVSPVAVTGANAHDGVDAFSFGDSGGSLSVHLEGPGVLSFWKKQNSGQERLALDDLQVTTLLPGFPAPPPGWLKYTLPIPAGRHDFRITSSNAGILDEFDWRPLPATTPEEALDLPAGVTVTAPDPLQAGAAAWGALSDDGTDSLLLMPDQPRPLEIQVPPRSTVSLRVRSAWTRTDFDFTGYLGMQNPASKAPVIPEWRTYTFSPEVSNGVSTVHLAAYGVPVLIDRLTVTTPPAGLGYFPWADGHGLATARNQPLDDPDGDGWNNLLEYSLGLDPTTADSAKAGTDTVPGTPETAVRTDPATGLTYPEIRYWRRNGQTATVETAQAPESTQLLGDAAGWTPSPLPGTVTTPGPEGWSRVVWRAAEPVAAGGRVFVRVRYSPF